MRVRLVACEEGGGCRRKRVELRLLLQPVQKAVHEENQIVVLRQCVLQQSLSEADLRFGLRGISKVVKFDRIFANAQHVLDECLS